MIAFCRTMRSTSSWSAPRARSSPASSTISRRPASRPSGRAGPRRSSKARRPSPRISAPSSASHRRLPPLHRCRGGQEPMCAITACPIVVKADGLAAGKGVVVAATFEEAEERHRHDDRRRPRRGRRRGGDRGLSRRRGGELLRPLRRHARDSASARRRTTSASSTATRARIPAAWAPIRPPPC